jgi:XTP/dITP diphosphohydrolase
VYPEKIGRVIVASGNPGKLREFNQLFAGSPIDLVSPKDLEIHLDVEESGATYLENAMLKAKAYASASGLPSLADDSGVEVDALGGAPGVRSARYGGPGLDDAGRVKLVLEQLRGCRDEQRGARFRCLLVLCPQGQEPIVAEGTCEGRIAWAPRGTRGFGYDPIFLLPQLGRTMAELEEQEKNRLSHRAVAVRRLFELLASDQTGRFRSVDNPPREAAF